ncbi:MAG: glutamate formimidoyltransferase [Candidatus Promineifilaceae bacterium]|nr:glutamate formimidoyltransferase [Candidatus Promineifilaceae bacterium]
MQKIVECVPNFSEGRRPDIYNAIAAAVGEVAGVHVLDVSADPDHNRTVITFVGSPAAVEEGAFRAIAEAKKHINLEHHSGEHPRIGATDVCPFVPVKNVSEEECVQIAERLGRRVGEELGIAVYLYGKAAKRPERVKLADIRRGQYERWRDEIGQVPEREPDFGPSDAHPWGATVIGVRPFLIAYNIYLNTDDVAIANRISRAIRYSSGGLRHVQAMGFMVEGQAQVSMNLTDFSRTPIYRVQELVRREAARYGLIITKAELIGMAPQDAFLEAAKWYLQADELEDDQIIEIRVADKMEEDFAPHNLIEATAAATPTPGGGSAAAAAGALGAALAQMVANLTVDKKKYADVEQEAREIASDAAELRQELTAAVTADAEAFQSLMQAWRDRSLSEVERQEAVEAATRQAALVPLKVARLSRRAARLAKQITTIGNANAVTDAAAGCLLAQTAARIASFNVRINAKDLQDQQQAEAWLSELREILEEVDTLATAAEAKAQERGGF